MDIYLNRALLNPVDQVFNRYGADEFASSTRSTVPLLSWLKHERRMFTSIFRALGLNADFQLHLEYQVPPPQGQGNPSHTDLMVISGMDAIAIEAKWTEPEYENVARWLNGGNNVNRELVLNGWLNLIRDRIGGQFVADDFDDVTYQMVHRAASACAAGANPTLVYLLFTSAQIPMGATVDSIEASLTKFRARLGNPANFPFYLLEVPLTTTAAFDALIAQQVANDPIAPLVISALQADAPLFHFKKYSITRIGL